MAKNTQAQKYSIQEIFNLIFDPDAASIAVGGSFTVQPGNTPNTTPWLVTPYQNSANTFTNAAALADGLSNPTTTQVGSNNLIWTSSTWERWGKAAITDSDSMGLNYAGIVAAKKLYNGSTWDRERANINGSILASAARTATTNSSDQTNHNSKGVLLFLNVTANPGAAETLSLKIQAKDPVSSTYIDIADAGVLFTAANGIKALMLHPGVLAADFASGITGKQAALPRVWRAVITHSASGSWTYSLGYELLK